MGNQDNKNRGKSPAKQMKPTWIPNSNFTKPGTTRPYNPKTNYSKPSVQRPSSPRPGVSGPYGTNVNPFLKSASQGVQKVQKYNPF